MKEQEIELLIKRLNRYEVGLKNLRPGHGFCSALLSSITEEKYPELWRYKPWYVVYSTEHHTFVNFLLIFSNSNSYWFGKWKYRKRVYILKDIIEDLTIKIETEKRRQKEIEDRLDDLLETNRKLAEKRKELNKLK